MTITQELLAALDDLLQAGASASSALRSFLDTRDGDGNPLSNDVSSAQAMLASAMGVDRNEQTLPQIVDAATGAVDKLRGIAQKIGDTATAQGLAEKLQRVRSQTGLPWLTILGIGAGLAALYVLWTNYSAPKKISEVGYPEPEVDTGPRVRMMGKALGALRGPSAGLGRHRRPRKKFGDVEEKYQFQPESALEGYRRRGPRKGHR